MDCVSRMKAFVSRKECILARYEFGARYKRFWCAIQMFSERETNSNQSQVGFLIDLNWSSCLRNRWFTVCNNGGKLWSGGFSCRQVIQNIPNAWSAAGIKYHLVLWRHKQSRAGSTRIQVTFWPSRRRFFLGQIVDDTAVVIGYWYLGWCLQIPTAHGLIVDVQICYRETNAYIRETNAFIRETNALIRERQSLFRAYSSSIAKQLVAQ